MLFLQQTVIIMHCMVRKPEAIVTALHEVQSRERFKLRSVRIRKVEISTDLV